MMKTQRGTRRWSGARGLALLAPLLLLQPVPTAAQAVLAEPTASVRHAAAIERGRALAQALLDEAALPGLSVAVGVDGEVVWAEGFGYADLENRVPVTPLTKFRIGSVSKTLTSMAIGLLHEQGRMDLDAPIQRYVSSFPQKQWPTTVRLVGGHIGGIRTYNYADYDDVDNEFLSSRPYRSVQDAIGIFRDDPLAHEPGTQYLYSSHGFNLLSAAVEGASGRDFLGYMRENVLEPLALRHTVPDHNDSIVAFRTRFYMRMDDGRLLNGRYADLSNKWAGGGYLSTPSDLVRWGSALLDGGLLKRETLEMLWTSQRTRDGKETGYGIGWTTARDINGRHIVGHGGGSIGGTTSFVVYPEERVVVAMTVNASVSPMGEATSATIAEAFLPRSAPTSSTAAAVDPTGSYRYTMAGRDGARTGGMLLLTGSAGDYRGEIVPDQTPTELRRTQDGSYSLRLPPEIEIVRVSVAGRDVRLIGADPSGFVNLWLTLDGDSFRGRWQGRGMDGPIEGTRQAYTGGAPRR